MVVQLAKTIKPKKLKVDKTRLNLLNALRKEGAIVKRELDKTVTTWQGEKPKFEVLIGLTGRDATVVIGPTGSDKGVNKWVWLDQGTRPHVIRARKKPTLAFQTGFKPKTRIRTFGSTSGGSFGPWRTPKSVNHPGIQAREWSTTIAKRRKKPFVTVMVKASRVTT